MFRTSLVYVSLFAVVGSCGGDDDSFDAGAGGSGGSAGTTGAGGSAAGSGGTVAGESGAAGAGGASGAAGAAGAAGARGEAGPVPGTELFDCEPPQGSIPELALAEVASGFTQPLLFTHAPGDTSRWFVVEQPGRIQVLVDGEVQSEAFLDIAATNVHNAGNEQGLLGLAFHPDYAENGRFYVNYTARAGVHDVGAGDTIVSEFTVSSEPNVADEASERVLLTVTQPYGNHNGGMLAFGPGGYLYIGLGDGGSGGDPDGNGQNTSTLLGSILRIDVEGTNAGEYGIPEGNLPGAAPEIWDYGLRNPWRFSFDGCTGDLYIGDVGQNLWEEINVVPSGRGHNNFGWNVREGAHCYGANECDYDGMIEPVLDYGREVGDSVTGGYVYRGSLVPGLRGTYFYADYSSRRIFAFRYVDGALEDERELSDELGVTAGGITSFGQDAAGEVYVVRRNGIIQRIEAAD